MDVKLTAAGSSHLTSKLSLFGAALKRARQIELLETLLFESDTRYTPISRIFQSQEIFGSTALDTPSVELASGHATARYGPIGTGRNRPCPSSGGFEAYPPSLPPLIRPTPRSPSNVNLEALIGECDSMLASTVLNESYESYEDFSPTLSFTTTSDRRDSDEEFLSEDYSAEALASRPQGLTSLEQAFRRAVAYSKRPPIYRSEGSPSLASQPIARVPPFVPLPRAVPEQPTSSLRSPRPLPITGVPLFNRVDFQLDKLDGSRSTQREVWKELCTLGPPSHFPESIPVIVECLVDRGITRGYPSNVHVADFGKYVSDRISEGHGPGHPNLNLLHSCKNDVRSAFLATFKQSWVPLPTSGSLQFKYLKRVASFYGYLYLSGMLHEEDFTACINFLSGLTPLPVDMLRALLSGDIQGY